MPKLDAPAKPPTKESALSIVITRMNVINKLPKLAYFDCTIGDISISGCSLVKVGDKAPFVGLPQRKGKDDKWYSVVYIPKGTLSDELTKAAIAHFEAQ